MKFWGLLLKLDILAPSVQLRIAGNTSSKSFIGVLLFLVYLGFAFWTSLSQYEDYKNTQNPRITNDQRFASEYQKFNLSESASLPIILGSYGVQYFTKPDELEAFFTIKLWGMRYELNIANGEFKKLITDIPYISCKYLIDSGELSLKSLLGIPKAFLDIIPEYGMCANTTGVDVTVVGSNSDKYLQTVELSISPCSLPGGIGCKPAAEVNKMWIQTLSPRYGIDMSSQEQPVKMRYSADDLFPLNVNNMQLFKYEMIRYEIVDSSGFLTNEIERAKFSTVDPKPPNWRMRDPTILVIDPNEAYYFTTIPYAVFTWASGTKFNLIRRNYQGVIDLVSNIGGLNSIIWVAVCTIHLMIHPWLEKRDLVRRVFGVTTHQDYHCSPSRHRLVTKPSPMLAKDASAILRDGSAPKDAQHITSNSTYTIVSKEVFDEASKLVDENLDIVSICKQLHEVKVLVSLLLKREQTELIPLATLCRQTSKKRKLAVSELSMHMSRMMSKVSDSKVMDSPGKTSKEAFGPKIKSQFKFQASDSIPFNSVVYDGAQGVAPHFKTLLEGLEEEFNKLIRSEIVRHPQESADPKEPTASGQTIIQEKVGSSSQERDKNTSSLENGFPSVKVLVAKQNLMLSRDDIPFKSNRVLSPFARGGVRPNSNNSSNPILLKLSSRRPLILDSAKEET